MQRTTASASAAPLGSQRNAAEAFRQAGSRAADSRTIRILLIDDDPQAEALIRMALSDAPFEHSLELATNGTAGLKRIRERQHDIYLVDQQLPDSTGLDIIHNAKADSIDQPFILLTGYGSGELDEAALNEGAADYVEKHLVGAHLQRSIRYSLRQWQSARMLHDREDQLRHAQKMEAIGRLAGGVAHDFNNILTAIVGYTDLLAERLDPEDSIAKDVAEVRRAADRAAALTKQLLSFSRKQFLHPTVLNLNDTVTGLIEMLPRVIGDHIQTTARLDPNIGLVRADASQMEQVLVNLVLNARDAMPTAGQLTIETGGVELDQERLAAESLTLGPGRYVMLAISDTGTGMDRATREHAFEPFFTTKPKGKGTGLGLATVYGIVDQSGGGIAIDTAPGRGTAVRIYLPTTDAAADVEQPRAVPVTASAGKETVLLVDDNDAVRELASNALRRRGYTVIEARSGEEAIDWATRTNGRPDLLVTDVVMPGLSGPNLAARLVQDNASLRVLYMSGYTDDAMPAHGKFWGGVPLLQKPFSPGQLAERVRQALDSPVNQA
jgi:two-component system cell cycle sensor histidine kinase/response regulator CckA